MFIKEIFHSYQGEGLWIGYGQIFVRFFGCNIHCAYCDEPDFSHQKQKYTLAQAVSEIQTLEQQFQPHSISMTGGEPLIQADAILQLAAHIQTPLFLETNATLPQQLDKLKDVITYFSIDYKPGYEEPFSQSMRLIQDKPNVYVKYILCKDFPDSDLQWVSAFLQQLPQSIALILQPVTPFAAVKEKATIADINRAVAIARHYQLDVRVIPQSHKMMGIQ